MVELITSLQNKIIKETAKLTEKKYRQQTGLFILEGIKLVQEIADSNWSIESVFVEQHLHLQLPVALREQLLQKSRYYYTVTPEIIAKISEVPSAQGIAVTAHMRNYPTLEQNFDQSACVLVLENIQDPGNLGTIIRTAVATGVSAILMTPDCADVYAPKVVRSSMGGILRIPILVMETTKAFESLQKQGFEIYATSLNNATSLYTTAFVGKVAVVLGNEANGVSRYALAQSSSKIFIPQIGKIESLNVSIAAGVIMYELLRQKINLGIYPIHN